MPSKERVDVATDELSELIADFELDDKDWLEARQAIQNRIKRAQNSLLGYTLEQDITEEKEQSRG